MLQQTIMQFLNATTTCFLDMLRELFMRFFEMWGEVYLHYVWTKFVRKKFAIRKVLGFRASWQYWVIYIC